jgi:tetratricopeptide (TPR) repeat protein
MGLAPAAIEILLEADRRKPFDAEINLLNGIALQRLDRHEEALLWFEAATRLDPKITVRTPEEFLR